MKRILPANHTLTRWGTALTAVAFWLPGVGGWAQTTTRSLAPGVVFTQEITRGLTPLVVNILRVDLSAPGVRVQTGQAQDVVSLAGPTKGREAIHALAARHHALAAVNADFFPFTGDPLGIAIRDGELISEPSANRACLGIGASGIRLNVLASLGTLTFADSTVINLSGINRVPHDGDAVVLTPTYTASPSVEKAGVVITLADVALPVRLSQNISGVVESVAPIGSSEQIAQTNGHSVQIVTIGGAAKTIAAHCHQGDRVQFRFDVVPSASPALRGAYPPRAGNVRMDRTASVWADVQQAVGGGPFLVRDGQIAVDGLAEGFGRADFIDKRHPRTAAGVDARGNLLLVTVDGRSTLSQGATLDELAAIMKRLGAMQALNFDGGGSTTMAVAGGVVNAPSDGRERPVADGLLVYADTPVSSDAGGDGLHIIALPASGSSLGNGTAQTPEDASGVAMDTPTIRAGEAARFQVVDGAGKTLRGLDTLWGTGDGFGFVSQTGVFTGFQVGDGTITAQVGGRQILGNVRVASGEPFRITARLNLLAFSGPERNMLTVSVTDKYGNPVGGQRIVVDAPNATLQTPLITGKSGTASSVLIWDAPVAQRLLTVSVGMVRSAPVRGDSAAPPPAPPKIPLDPDDRP